MIFSHEAELDARNAHMYFLTVSIAVKLGLVVGQSEFFL